MITINTKDLEMYFNEVMQKLKQDSIEEIAINTDYYQFIATSDWANFDQKTEPLVGSLIDDITSLGKINQPDYPFTYTDFDRLAFLLMAISQELNPA